MKFTLIALLIIGTTTFLSAQDYSKLEDIKLEESEDFVNNESKVKECAEFILDSPVTEERENKNYCTQFILRWMDGTNYTFELGSDFLDLTNRDSELTMIYLASLAKAALDYDDSTVFPNKINKDAKNIFLDYCEKPQNNVKISRKIKKELKKRY